MPVPARKKANAAGRRRRSHDALKPITSSTCPKCASPVQPHRACKSCGFYAGRQVVDMIKSTGKVVKQIQKKTKKVAKKEA